MLIHQAAKHAVNNNTFMFREDIPMLKVFPTNSSPCCILWADNQGKQGDLHKCWNPTLDDLTSNKWRIGPVNNLVREVFSND
jgi:hypothetical protein